jgi:hypothetical protein
VKYFIPEWDDRVDPGYDFINDMHSTEHKEDPVKNDAYIWNIFGIDNVPIDGVLVSRMPIIKNKRKYERAISEGIHKVLRLPQDFEILGDCGAFGYVKEKLPPFDPIETLQYYRDLGFNYGVSVDHLVVTQFEKDKEARMRITYENGIKAYNEWSKKFKEDFQLLLAVQGWDIRDYLKMYKNYMKLGATHIAFGGLARSPTEFILKLINELIKEIKGSTNIPDYLHFFGLARFPLFPKFRDLEDSGVKVGFDSASYLRKAWLSAASTQLNYLALEGKGYSAIRIPFATRKKWKTKETLIEKMDESQLRYLEQECLNTLRLFDKDKTGVESVISVLSKLSKALGETPEIIRFYRRTLEDKPWKSCQCPICQKIGIEVVLFRGNNRNRRRGFHNTYVFYSILKNSRLWPPFTEKKAEKQETELPSLSKSDKVLVITGCTKEKLAYNDSLRVPAKKMYHGRLFKTVRNYCEAKGFDYVIISAKYGLILPDDIIGGYEKVLRTKEDVKNIQPQVEEKLRPLLKNYERIIVVAGKKYREVLQNLWDDRFLAIKSKGYGDLCSIVEKAIPKEKSLLEFT